jgi:dTDP-4-amino-4,6-dideoxy-D-galactose acyltransferase
MKDFQLLDWDTHFFGFKIASVKSFETGLDKLKNIIGELREQDFKLAYCFVDPEDNISNESLKQLPGFLADEKVTYAIMLTDVTDFPVADHISGYDLTYTSDKLKNLALQSGLYSRFKIDPGFQNNEYDRLYTEWIEKSVDRKLANEVLVYSEGNELLGFITLVLRGNTGAIGLIAVDENQRGKAIGKKLIGAALKYFSDHKVTSVEVVTQKANGAACRFYESCGFKIKSILNIYHLWIR